MTTNYLAVVAGLVGVIVTAAVTAWLGQRARRGTVATSEAKDLWDALRAELAAVRAELAAVRAEYRTDIAALQSRIGSLSMQLDACLELHRGQQKGVPS